MTRLQGAKFGLMCGGAIGAACVAVVGGCSFTPPGEPSSNYKICGEAEANCGQPVNIVIENK